MLSKGQEKTLEPEQRESGAGLGLVTALKNANKLVFNLAPGLGAEVIALFDLDLLAQGRTGVRSVHVFTERRKQTGPGSQSEEKPRETALAPLVIGALAIVLIIFGVVGLVRRMGEAPVTNVHAEVAVPDGETREVPVRVGNSDVLLKVARKGGHLVITSDDKPGP